MCLCEFRPSVITKHDKGRNSHEHTPRKHSSRYELGVWGGLLIKSRTKLWQKRYVKTMFFVCCNHEKIPSVIQVHKESIIEIRMHTTTWTYTWSTINTQLIHSSLMHSSLLYRQCEFYTNKGNKDNTRKSHFVLFKIRKVYIDYSRVSMKWR